MGLASIELNFTENEYKYLREITWIEGFNAVEDFLMCISQKVIRAKIKSITCGKSHLELEEELKSEPEDNEKEAYQNELFFGCLDLMTWHYEFRISIGTLHRYLCRTMIKIYDNLVIQKYCYRNSLEETLIDAKNSFYGRINNKLISAIIQKLIELHPDYKNEILESGFLSLKGSQQKFF